MRCPHCNKEFDYREAETDLTWVRIIEMMPAFNNHARLVFEYCELFGVSPLLIKARKLLRLLTEVGALFSQKKFTWKKAVYEISEEGIVQGLRTTCNANLSTPLTDHNYLKKVLTSIAAEEQKERRAALDKEKRTTEDRKQKTENKEEGEVVGAEETRRKARQLIETMWPEEKNEKDNR